MMTDQQVRLYMSKRKHHSQEVAAAKAGISVRSARRIEHDARLPSQKPRRYWRSRPDPLADVWDTEIVPLLMNAPRLQAITILRKLQDDHPDQYPDGVRRTLERRVSHWRAMAGPPKEVFFPQLHEPGARGLSDFTDMADLRITVAGVRFDHRLYHFVLAFSRWEYANVVEGGESFEALSVGLQNALWQAGGCPREHRTDSLSAAFKNLQDEADFTVRYAALLEHYGMSGTRNNRGQGHENGSVESSHRYLKEAVDQALMLRGHRDFNDRAAYDEFLREVVMRRNRRNAAAFRIEREQLIDLPLRRTTDFVEEEARVTRCSTFTIRGILYSAPSRLIGHRLKVRVYGDRLDCYLSGAMVHSTPRGSHAASSSRRAINYRHFIEALKRKPGAFKGLAFRDDLFPREAYRGTWEQLEARMTQRDACRTMVGLLELAALDGVEAVLAGRLAGLLVDGALPDLPALREEFAPRHADCPAVSVVMPPASSYDTLLVEEVSV
ncbi:IS21 family transposase [Paraburkholderia megapolitana]|uniref:Integrase core domain-containing protein n=2 Tax=Paraburkholderia megapolitana TaxID=420953 RepID=A0A1I3UR65_9BURK|nr:IS21 family transposase [Paraburkholderia megapolitana]SFJ85233.1 Integrase core domain-containing protein [Paraburkholderia megapolitana]